MNFNTILFRFGLDPKDFINCINEPIKHENNFIYEVSQKNTLTHWPYCNYNKLYVKGYYWTEKNCNSSAFIKDILRIKKIRLKCSSCSKTFSPEIHGLEPYKKISNQTLKLINNEFLGSLTFSEIAKKYDISTARALQLFDEYAKYVPRLSLPEVLCIDEIKFSKSPDNTYVCILYDFHKREIVDIIKNRRSPYLHEYFNKIPLKERQNVKFVISDMYDAYSTIKRYYFKNAIHIVDTFHIIRLLTNAVNILRIKTMNSSINNFPYLYNFLKKHWKLFLCRTNRIPDKFYVYQKTGEVWHYDSLLKQSLKLNEDFFLAYNTLQDLYRYELKFTHESALLFVEKIKNNLLSSSNELLKATGRSFHKWRFEIASAFAYTQNNIRYTNAIAESINNKIKTITKNAYGYKDFERFRKRVLLNITYGKKTKKRPRILYPRSPQSI